MKRFMSKKVAVVGIAVGLTLGLSGAAFAYFLSTGTGAGTATVGSASVIQLSSSVVGPLYPGGGSIWVPISVHNPSAANEYVGTISGVVTTQGGCLSSWFTVAPVSYNTTVLAGATTTSGKVF
jgi:hypothetical protein